LEFFPRTQTNLPAARLPAHGPAIPGWVWRLALMVSFDGKKVGGFEGVIASYAVVIGLNPERIKIHQPGVARNELPQVNAPPVLQPCKG
jgi:hypothetical protein